VIGSNAADYVSARSLGLGNPVQVHGTGGDDNSLLAGGGDDEYDGARASDCVRVFAVPGDNGTDTYSSVETIVSDPDPCPWP